MPGGNKTGPFGEGPKTGRGLGYCSGFNWPGFHNSNENIGNGFGRGWGNRWGRSNKNRYRQGYGRFAENRSATVSEVTLLENEARILKEQLASIEMQLSDFKKKTD